MRILLIVVSLVILTSASADAGIKDCKRLKLGIKFLDSSTGNDGASLSFDGMLLHHRLDWRYRTVKLQGTRDLYSWVILNKDGLAAKIVDILDMVDYRQHELSSEEKQSLKGFIEQFELYDEVQLEPNQLGDQERYDGSTDVSVSHVPAIFDTLEINYVYYRCQ